MRPESKNELKEDSAQSVFGMSVLILNIVPVRAGSKGTRGGVRLKIRASDLQSRRLGRAQWQPPISLIITPSAE